MNIQEIMRTFLRTKTGKRDDDDDKGREYTYSFYTKIMIA
jgi:hypothetical protein